jgi:hypothetical protein
MGQMNPLCWVPAHIVRWLGTTLFRETLDFATCVLQIIVELIDVRNKLR